MITGTHEALARTWRRFNHSSGLLSYKRLCRVGCHCAPTDMSGHRSTFNMRQSSSVFTVQRPIELWKQSGIPPLQFNTAWQPKQALLPWYLAAHSHGKQFNMLTLLIIHQPIYIHSLLLHFTYNNLLLRQINEKLRHWGIDTCMIYIDIYKTDTRAR